MLLQGAVPRAELLGQGAARRGARGRPLLPRPVRVRLGWGGPACTEKVCPGTELRPCVNAISNGRRCSRRRIRPSSWRAPSSSRCAPRACRARARRVRQGLYVLVRAGWAGADCSERACVGGCGATGTASRASASAPRVDGAALRVAVVPELERPRVLGRQVRRLPAASASTAGRARRATSRCARRLRPPRQVCRRRVRVRHRVVGRQVRRARVPERLLPPRRLRQRHVLLLARLRRRRLLRARVPGQAPGPRGAPRRRLQRQGRVPAESAVRVLPGPRRRRLLAPRVQARLLVAGPLLQRHVLVHAGVHGRVVPAPDVPDGVGGRRAVLGARRVPRVCVRVRARVRRRRLQPEALPEQLQGAGACVDGACRCDLGRHGEACESGCAKGEVGECSGRGVWKVAPTAANAPPRARASARRGGAATTAPTRSARGAPRTATASTARASAPTASAAPTARRRSRPTSRRSRVQCSNKCTRTCCGSARAWWGRRRRTRRR